MTPRELLLYSLVAFVPIVFYRGATEVFEFPKTELLTTGALLLLGASLAREIARMRVAGSHAWKRGLGRRIAGSLRRDPLGGSILLFLVSATLSALASIRPDASVFGAHESEAGLKTAFATAVVYFTSRALSSDTRHLERLTGAAAAGLAVALSYAVLQLTGLDPFPWTRSAMLGGLRRVPGTLGHANHLGATIAMTLPLLAWLAAATRSRPARLFCIALAAVSLPVLASTLSRGAWVASVAGIVVYGLLSWRARREEADGREQADGRKQAAGRARRYALAAVILALAAFLIPLSTPFRPELLHRLRQITDVSAPSTQSRVHLWRAGIRMAQDRPLLGVGTDAYITAFPRYRTPEYWQVEWNGTSAKAHNELIQIAATQGVLGLLAALLVVFFAARVVLDLTRRGDAGVRQGAAATGGALAAFAVQDLASFTVASTGVLAAALAGWAAGTREGVDAKMRESTREGVNAKRAERPGRAALAIGLGAAAVLWGLLVLLPWLADASAAPAMRAPAASDERISGLTRAAAFAPWDARYASELGRSLLARAFGETDPPRRYRDVERALEVFGRATWLSPRDGELCAFHARAMASHVAAVSTSISVEGVKAEFEKAIALEPENPNVLELAAQGYLEMGRTADARTVALQCARLFPGYALPMADLGVAALIEGRPEAAADTLTLALRRNWHGEEAAEMAAKGNYVAAVREMRLRDVLKK